MAFESSGKRPRSTIDDPAEEDILRLVAEREAHRQARRFAESDSIRDQLRSMGVELYDQKKEWKSSDGRHGKLFTAGPEACTWSDDEIQERVYQREEARKSKDWATADSIRDELRNTGVEVDDKEAVWRTATGRSGTYNGQPVFSQQAPTTLSMDAIRMLVAKRERLRAESDFEAADELRRQLANRGVELFDNDRIWKSSDGQQGVIITGGHEVACHLNDSDISYYVKQREDARSAKDWREADSIRDDLRRQGVELMDNQKMWCTADGRQGRYQGGLVSQQPQRSAQQKPAPSNATHFALPGPVQKQQPAGNQSRHLPSSPVTQSASLMTLSTVSIEALVSGRESARDNRDWEASDSIRADLRAHGVDVWDKEKVWRANDGRTGPLSKLA